MTVQPPDDGLTGLRPIEPRPAFGKMPNARHQDFRGFMTGASYGLAIVEFDDQGVCYDRGQMNGVAQKLDELTEKKEDAILLVFVHGWKHDARSDDENLSAFRDILGKTVAYEREGAQSEGKRPRPVLGVFVGWRGLSEFGPVDAVANVTFWTRQAAGHRVATGSVRELFGRLRRYRRDRRRAEVAGSPLLVITGHSFGGMIVFSALAQSLIEAATVPTEEVVSSFADLVLLINPAIEGARYIPIQDLVGSTTFKEGEKESLPIFICAQAENDQPVGTFFRLGNARRILTQATIGDLEKDCITRAIGFVPAFRTHRLTGRKNSEAVNRERLPGTSASSPFWVVGADKFIINGHGGIWQPPFRDFLKNIVFRHVESTR